MNSKPLLNIFLGGLIVAGLYFYFKGKESPSEPENVDIVTDNTPEPEQNQEAYPAFWEACNECLGRHAIRIVASHDRYLSWVDAVKGPSTKSNYISYGLYETYDPKDCIQRLKQPLLDANFPTGMDESAAHYLYALQRVYDLTRRMNRYYELEDYKDDNLAFGIQMNDTLLAAFKDYFESDLILRNASKQVFESQMAVLVSYDETSTEDYYLIQLIDASYRLAQLSLKPNRKTIDLEALKTTLSQYQEKLDAYEAFVKSGDMELSSSREYYVDRHLAFLKSAKTLVREFNKKTEDEGTYSWGDFNDDAILKELTTYYNALFSLPKSASEGIRIPLPPMEERFFYRAAK